MAGGAEYISQCPVCDLDLRWPSWDSPEGRIARAVYCHEPGCPAAAVDPAWLQRRSRQEALERAAQMAGDSGCADSSPG
jgi:hypothetical protein